MPVWICANKRLDPGMIAYGPHTRAMAASVPAISPRGTLKRKPGRAVVFLRVGAVRLRTMVTPVGAVGGWPAGVGGRLAGLPAGVGGVAAG